jgi:alcohol oxidase
VLEAGHHTRDIPKYVQPARYFNISAGGDEALRLIVSQTNPKTNDRSTVTVVGRCVGGGSAVNCTLITLLHEIV